MISPGRSTAWGAEDAGLCVGRRCDSPPMPIAYVRFAPLSAMNFRNQNVTDSDMSAAGMAMVPLVLLVPLVFTIPPQSAIAVVLS